MMRIAIIPILQLLVPGAFAQVHVDRDADSLMRVLSAAKSTNAKIGAFFSLAEYYMAKPGENKEDLDRAFTYLNKAEILITDKRSVDFQGFSILLQSFFAREKRQYAEGKKLAATAVDMLKMGENKLYLGKAYYGLSEYYDYLKNDEIKEKIRLVELACQEYAQTEDKIRYANTLMFLADILIWDHQRPRAMKLLDEVLQTYQSINYTRLSGVYVLYSTIYSFEENYKQCLSYALLALKDAEAAHDSSIALSQINNQIGMAHYKLKEWNEAILYFNDALQIAIRLRDNNSIISIAGNASRCYLKLKKPDLALALFESIPSALRIPRSHESLINLTECYLRIYIELKNYNTAEKYANRLLELIKLDPPTVNSLTNVYLDLINLYLETNRYTNAGIYISKIDTLAEKAQYLTYKKNNLYLKFRLDTSLGNYRAAIDKLVEYKRFSDSLFNEESSKQIKQLEIEYETEKTRGELKIADQNILVLKQKNELQKGAIDKANLAKNITIGGIIISIVISFLFYRQYKLRQKRNAIIMRQNEQLQHLLSEKDWLVKEIHHRVKNNFHIVASLLEIQSSYLKNDEALSAIRESQHRIHSMSLIHQKLYQSDRYSIVHMPEYIYEIVEYLKESFDIRKKIRFELNIEQIKLNHAIAITLGLIVNEAITNAIKYAFVEMDEGTVNISLKHISTCKVLLCIADNGRGLPADYDQRLFTSMGMDLLKGLSEEIGGALSIENRAGTHISISFNTSPQIVYNQN